MDSLENLASAPFELGTYKYNLNWKFLKIGSAKLEFSKINKENLPICARGVYFGGDLYKIVFEAKTDLPILQLIFEKGKFTTYCAIKQNEVVPLLAMAKTKILMRETNDFAVYDLLKNELIINDTKQKVSNLVMPTLRDPSSHVVHLLFQSRKNEGKYFCGYYHAINGEILPLELEYTLKNNKLAAFCKISANTYFIDTDLLLELPYGFDSKKELYLPSLKEKVSITHKIIGKITFEFNSFS